jgi:hypothetical protein
MTVPPSGSLLTEDDGDALRRSEMLLLSYPPPLRATLQEKNEAASKERANLFRCVF